MKWPPSMPMDLSAAPDCYLRGEMFLRCTLRDMGIEAIIQKTDSYSGSDTSFELSNQLDSYLDRGWWGRPSAMPSYILARTLPVARLEEEGITFKGDKIARAAAAGLPTGSSEPAPKRRQCASESIPKSPSNRNTLRGWSDERDAFQSLAPRGRHHVHRTSSWASRCLATKSRLERTGDFGAGDGFRRIPWQSEGLQLLHRRSSSISMVAKQRNGRPRLVR